MFLPFYHSINYIDLRESSIAIPNLPGYTADNVPVVCSGSLFYKIVDGYKACFSVSDVKMNIANTGQAAMRAVLGAFSYDQVISDRNGLNNQLNKVIGDSLIHWGVECTRFEVQSFQPANREVERQLELQMEAERNRRKQILDTQAQINIAEGHKQRVILESEGHLQAKANEAEASFKTVVRGAEARLQQAVMESNALAQQVEQVANALAAQSDSKVKPIPTAEDRKLALSTLVELRRLEQLKAIAQGQGNSTYFFGEKSIGAGQPTADMYNADFVEQVKKASKKGPDPASATVIP